MKLCDVNIFIYAHRKDAREHEEYARYVLNMASGDSAFGLSETVLQGFIRIVTNPRVFKKPTPVPIALEFCNRLRACEQSVVLVPGVRNWDIFQRLCREVPATGKLVADAAHAALAIEHGCEWISTDADFARFSGLNWSHPLRR